jgi:hypothetical protein
MADPQTYVEISKFTITKTFDSKYNAKSIDSMTKIAEQAVKASKSLTLDKPKEKGAKGWALVCALESLGPDKAGKKFEAKVSGAIATWPGKSMKSFPTGSAGFAIASADEKVSASDVDQLVTGAAKELMKSAVPFMEKTKPS